MAPLAELALVLRGSGAAAATAVAPGAAAAAIGAVAEAAVVPSSAVVFASAPDVVVGFPVDSDEFTAVFVIVLVLGSEDDAIELVVLVALLVAVVLAVTAVLAVPS